MRQKGITLLAGLILLAGIGLLAYPAVSNGYYDYRQKALAAHYDRQMAEAVTAEEKAAAFQACQAYNTQLRQGGVLLTDPFDAALLDPAAMPYAGLLNTDGQGTMGYLEIPAIQVTLPIGHGTGEAVLKQGVGHLQGTSLPVGGAGTHCVLSAHTGLNSRKLFTDLDQLETGDVFYLHVLGEILAYQVDQIRVVLPENTEDLTIAAVADFCTLVTCTPYGINSHRLLVRGSRVPLSEARMPARPRKSTWRTQYVRALLAGTGLLGLVLAFGGLVRKARTGRRRDRRRKP